MIRIIAEEPLLTGIILAAAIRLRKKTESLGG